jgi:hypothetical protein
MEKIADEQDGGRKNRNSAKTALKRSSLGTSSGSNDELQLSSVRTPQPAMIGMV